MPETSKVSDGNKKEMTYAQKKRKLQRDKERHEKKHQTKGEFFNNPFDEDKESTVVGKLHDSKYIHAKRNKMGYYYLTLYPGGWLPPEFKTLFTSFTDLQETVQVYLRVV